MNRKSFLQYSSNIIQCVFSFIECITVTVMLEVMVSAVIPFLKHNFLLYHGAFSPLAGSPMKNIKIKHWNHLKIYSGTLRNIFTYAVELLSISVCDPTMNKSFFETVRHRFSFPQTPCKGTSRYVGIYSFVNLHRKFALSYFTHSEFYFWQTRYRVDVRIELRGPQDSLFFLAGRFSFCLDMFQ